MLLALVLMLSFVSCKGGDDSESGGGSVSSESESVSGGGSSGGSEDNGKIPDASNPTEDFPEHKVSGTLHKVNVTPSEKRVFVSGGKTEYKLVYASTAYISKAASFIASHVFEATGANLETETSPVWSENAKYIVVGDKDFMKTAGVTEPTENIGSTGYGIKTKGNSVFITANGYDGYQLGAICFLRQVVGYDMMYDDLVIYEKDGATIPDMDIVERPDFDYRSGSNNAIMNNTSARYGMGFTDNTIFLAPQGKRYHNTFTYLPKDKYENAHPEWYCDNALGKFEHSQLCYTAHGDKDSLKEMQTIIAEQILELAADTELKNVTVTQEDTESKCECDTCNAIVSEYGSISAAIIMFMNGVDDIVQAKLEEEAAANGTEKKELNIVFFAYHFSSAAPSKLDDKVKCNEHVGVLLALSRASYTHTLYESINSSPLSFLEGWKDYTDKLYVWMYQNNFATNSYQAMYNSFDSVIENYRAAYLNNAVLIMNQGNWESINSGFARFKDYIDSHALFDVNVNYVDLYNKFFKYYYGDGGEYMKQFFDEGIAQLRYIERAYPGEQTGLIVHQPLNKSKFWPFRMLENWKNLCEQAIAANKKYEVTNPQYYKAVTTHITVDSIFPRLYLCQLYPTSYSDEVIAEMRSSLATDCRTNMITHTGEAEYIAPLFESWGV